MKVHLKLAGVKLDKKVRELHKHPYIELYLSFFLSFFFLLFFRLLTERQSFHSLPCTVRIPSIHFHTPCSPGYDWLFRPVRIYVPNLQPGVYLGFLYKKNICCSALMF